MSIIKKTAPPDSALYYSLRMFSGNDRDAVVAVHAFYREMEDIVFSTENPELAQIKFNWYRSEMMNWETHPPAHPVFAFLEEKNRDRLLQILDGFEQLAISHHFETEEDVVVHWMRTAGARELLLIEITHDEKKVPDEIVYQLMLGLEIVNHIQYLRRYVKNDCLFFSADELQKFQVTHEMLHASVTTEAIQKLLAYQAEKAERAFAAIEKLSKSERVALAHLLTRCQMANALLQEIRNTDFRVLEQFITLTPMRYWWIAFWNSYYRCV